MRQELLFGAERGLDFESMTLDGELMLIDGAMCHYLLRRDHQLTIRILISTRPGAGQEVLERLKAKKAEGATSIFARCPADLPANEWYEKRGFVLEGIAPSRKGRLINTWRLHL